MKRLEKLNKTLVKKYKSLVYTKNLDIKVLKKKIDLLQEDSIALNPDKKMTIQEIIDEFKISRKTIDRMRKDKGLNPPVESDKKGVVWIVRKEFEKLFYD